MTAPDDTQTDTAPVLDGTDVAVDPVDVDAPSELPATSDPDEMADGGHGGVAGEGGAG